MVTCEQLTRREIAHQGLQVEANATALVLRLVQLPPPPGLALGSAWLSLLKRLLSVSIRVHGKAKSWVAEFAMYGSPLATTHPKEQGECHHIHFCKFQSHPTLCFLLNFHSSWNNKTVALKGNSYNFLGKNLVNWMPMYCLPDAGILLFHQKFNFKISLKQPVWVLQSLTFKIYHAKLVNVFILLKTTVICFKITLYVICCNSKLS